ncbi:hypothetical protein COCC4DRAFT_71263 [Bipolaris maydis ATCC 48331]|uniref:Peptidase metallopeptidase domain-containing protein n=2 Tax=Cochliobolus heterostrophus TaxID=5016 RepID=M2SM12_COCH5|nr:uncharacterized protein COCC4DRAFT_71263 [Bipolaris maydis ATCC 48331]EMD86345.1 hypothetical protein COCHEDRAFT_1228378 [Bipolaris maydis C5]KAJ5029989.1 hypothetical protein J3E73DRAFT_378070 [Bipolaris maydis]ENI06292.1 hypothetical protein COCC4DRAFT_71263 [Bipolaris maydis ATCC 48331]KAJ5064992.1 hypothetical protein J3E74DRAFT_414061 [Bipolaris maydis]KAJ6200206.1 hypothetical protein J3E72DRAFT_382801 [Bipolaris maydis]
MASSILTLVFSTILAARPVLAGSRAWESSIVYTPPSYTELHGDLFVPEKENATIGTGSRRSTNTIKKRYVTINPGTANSDDRLWPNGKITYCFESKATKELFFEDLLEARKLWENSGLGSGFDWEEKDESYCNNNANRPNFLLITKSDGLSCTVGIPPLNKMSGDPENRGPLMRLTADLDIGKQNLVANFAHQMGHAWGLHHEHQNPAFWSSDYAAAGGNVFGASNFKCQNLKDYASVAATLTADQMKKACTSRAFAKAHRFSAAEYLPFADSTAYRASKSVTEPDWDSIMIYDSGMGSVLTKPNGDQIKQVLAPSQRDVEGLKLLYGISPKSKFNPLGSKSNSKRNKFNDIRKKERDSGCGEVPDDDPKGQVLCTPATCGGGSCPAKKARAVEATSNRKALPRAIPTTADPVFGFLNKPTQGGLDAFAKEFFDTKPFLVDLEDVDSRERSTSIFMQWKQGPFMAGVMGLYGCTSVLLTSQCGMFMSHHWESWWKGKTTEEQFRDAVIKPLVEGDIDNPSFLGFPQLPKDCLTKEKNLKATIFTPTFVAGTKSKYQAKVAMLVSAVAESMSIAESDIKIQLYDANVDDNYKDDWQQVKNTDTASGKVMLTYNNDIFRDGNRAAYQVWAGALVTDVKQANSAINTAMMQDDWKPNFSRKRTILRFFGFA